jgi:hypothetical protein
MRKCVGVGKKGKKKITRAIEKKAEEKIDMRMSDKKAQILDVSSV